jgi:PAS domain S-box-containing protein
MDLSGLDITTLELLSYSTNMFFVITKDLSEESYFCTSNVKQISGYSLEEIKSFPQKHYSLISEEDRETVNKILADIEKDTTTNSIELSYRIKSKAGNNIWLKENLVLYRNHDNKIKERTSAVSDITKLKQSEFDAKKQIEALKELNTNKDNLLILFRTILGHRLLLY